VAPLGYNTARPDPQRKNRLQAILAGSCGAGRQWHAERWLADGYKLMRVSWYDQYATSCVTPVHNLSVPVAAESYKPP